MSIHVVTWRYQQQTHVLDVDTDGLAARVAIELVEMGRTKVTVHEVVDEPGWWPEHVELAKRHVERRLKAQIGGGDERGS
jgi:hypothetical protein